MSALAALRTMNHRDRFRLALFAAVSLHALVILGVGFSSDENVVHHTSIDVTLSLANDAEAPEDADFIAATNQQGAGSEQEVSELTSQQAAAFDTNQFQEVMSQQAPRPEQLNQQQAEVVADAPSDFTASLENSELTEALENPPSLLDRDRLVQEIASLEARIAADQQALARMPRTKRINSVSTRSAVEAAYLDAWRQKCERIGAINYPAGFEGEVLILVSILADGTLENVKVLKGSGYDELDQAALSTVRQAAPFQPFNVDMRKSYDRLEFTRWWQFSRRQRLSSG